MKVQRKGEERRGLEESTDCPKVGGYKNLKRCKEGKKQCIAEKKGDRRDERLEEKAKRKGNRRGDQEENIVTESDNSR